MRSIASVDKKVQAQMDHLLYPPSTHIAPLQIPFLCDGADEYDGLSFTTYPVRKGWTNSADSLQWLQCSDDELSRRVQLWLYFGLLSEFCGRVVLKDTLRRVNTLSASPELYTKNLSQVIETRKRTKNLEKARSLLAEALRFSELVEGRVTSNLGSLHLISCSVRVLLQTLNCAQGLRIQVLSSTRRYQAGRRWPLKFSAGFFDEWKISPAKAIKYRMADLGWCPAQVTDLSQKYSCTTLYYISGIRRESHFSHTQCTLSACIAYNIDESSYVSQHTENCNDRICSLIEATAARVTSIIENYEIPLMSCLLSSDGKIQTEIIRAEPGLEYIAISHVWSGGLGNPTNNGLPECQVSQLMHRIRCLRGIMSNPTSIRGRFGSEKPILFWMDTFCIPVGKASRSARRKAIDSMAEIYSGATAILVLDPELQRFSYSDLKAEQALAHVLSSSWMSRCWTLQEASLSNSWFIQYEDNAINLANAMKQARMKTKIDFLMGGGNLKSSIRRTLFEELSQFLIEMGEVRYQRRGRYSRSEIWNLRQLENHQAHYFATTWNNFLGRTTSKLEDLHQILAGMEDIKVAGIRALAIEDRMKAILKCHATLPIDLLFCPCERIHDGNSVNVWAPRFPQGQRLDGMLGSMKVFTNHLFIPAEVASKHLQLYFLAPKGLPAEKFQLEIPKAGRFWIEMYPTERPQHMEVEGVTTCLMLPIMDTQSNGHIWPERHGARFLLRENVGSDLYLTYDRPFRMYTYDGESDISNHETLLPPTYPYVSTELDKPASRVFIDCALESWPTAPLLYDSLEGPIFSKPAPYIQLGLYFLIPLIWILSSIITMAAAPRFKIARLPVFYCYMGRTSFLCAEVFWYAGVLGDIERVVWSLNAARSRSDFSSYDTINRRPLLLFGFKRGALTLSVSIVFLCLGAIHHRVPWAFWFGVLLLCEFILRITSWLCWFTLPRRPSVRAWLERAKGATFIRFQAWWIRARKPLLQKHARVPFTEEDAVPFQETSSSVFGSYIGLFQSFWSKDDGDVETTRRRAN